MHPLLLEVVAIVGGTVHTMETGAEPAAATVIVRDGRIEAVLDPAVPAPADARVIDAKGRHLVPGLIDGMVYFDADHDALYIAQGVTTIRDLGGDPVSAFLGRLPDRRNRVPGPALVTPGTVIDGDPPSSSNAVIVRSADVAPGLLQILLDENVDFFSVQLGLPADALARTIELAHEHELEVWGPLPRAVTLERALELGQDGILFLDGLLPEGVSWDFVQPGAFKRSVELLDAAGAGLVPLLHATALRVVDQAKEPFDLGLLDPLYEAQWKAELAFRRTLGEENYVETGTRIAAKQRALLAMLHAGGVRLLPGSGAPHPWLFPGKSLHEELAEWEAAGLAPMDVLAAATRGAAEMIGIGSERGTITAGKSADLLVIAKDPREGVAALRDPEIVVVRGHVLPRAELDDRLAAVRTRLDALRAELARPIDVKPPDLPEGAVVLRGLVEVSTLGQKIRAERYAVVREPDGAITYVGRTAYRVGEGESAREMTVLQRTRGGKLDEFEVELVSSGDRVRSHGLWVADQMRIERRVNDLLIDTKTARDRLACADAGSVTTLLMLTQLVRTDPFEIVTFHEMLEPELAQWGMNYGGEKSLVHAVRTHKGAINFRSTAKGSVELARTAVGGGTLELVLLEEDALGGPGLPPPAEKLALVGAPRDDGAAPAADGATAGPPDDDKGDGKADGKSDEGAGDGR